MESGGSVEVVTESGKWLLTQGALGVGLIGTIFIIVILWRDNLAARRSISDCQEARIKSAETLVAECTRCITNVSQHIAMNTAAMSTAASVNEARLVALEALKESVNRGAEEMRRLSTAIDATGRR